MAKTTIDELLEALETVRILQEAIGKHDQAIARILDKLDRLEQRLDNPALGAPKS